MNFPKFVIFTFVGSFFWAAGLAWAGATWQPRAIREAMRPFDLPIAIIIVLLVAWFLFRNFRNRRQSKSAGETLSERG